MKINQLVSIKHNVEEAQVAALLKPKKTANFGQQPSGYTKTTSNVAGSIPNTNKTPMPTNMQGSKTATQTPPTPPATIPNKTNPASQPSNRQQVSTAQQTSPAQVPQQAQATSSKLSKFVKGATDVAGGVTNAVGGAIRGVGNIASQTAGGLTQTVGAGLGGFQRGVAGAKAGQNFNAIAPSSGGDQNLAYRAAGDSELADLRARLDSIEQLIRSKS